MNHTFICCGFAEVPPEVQSSDSLDGPQSEGRSSPIDRSWFGKEETALESPTPVHPEPIRPSVAPTQSYYLNGELPVCLTSFSAIVQLLIGEVKHVFLCVCLYVHPQSLTWQDSLRITSLPMPGSRCLPPMSSVR